MQFKVEHGSGLGGSRFDVSQIIDHPVIDGNYPVTGPQAKMSRRTEGRNRYHVNTTAVQRSGGQVRALSQDCPCQQGIDFFAVELMWPLTVNNESALGRDARAHEVEYHAVA
jgi:hypothetical protein